MAEICEIMSFNPMNPPIYSSGDESGNPPSFESALTELQQIVGALEAGATGLEDSLKQYERGSALLRHCYGLLESAEQRIEVLTGRNSVGELQTAPFDATATHEPAAAKAGRRQRTKAPKPAAEPVAEADPDALF